MHEAPARGVPDRVPDGDGRIAGHARPVEVEGIAPLDVRGRRGPGQGLDREGGPRLVGAPEVDECGIANVHRAGVHEHHVPAPDDGRVLRADGDRARVVRDRGLQIGARAVVVEPERGRERDHLARDARDPQHLVLRRMVDDVAGPPVPVPAVVMRAGEDERVPDLPALRRGRERQRAVAGHRVGGGLQVHRLGVPADLGRPVRDDPAPEQHRVVDGPVIGDDDLGIGRDRRARGADLESPGRVDHQRLDLHSRGDVRPFELAVDADGVEPGGVAINGDGDAGRHEHARPVAGDAAAPGGRIAPAATRGGVRDGRIGHECQHRVVLAMLRRAGIVRVGRQCKGRQQRQQGKSAHGELLSAGHNSDTVDSPGRLRSPHAIALMMHYPARP